MQNDRKSEGTAKERFWFHVRKHWFWSTINNGVLRWMLYRLQKAFQDVKFHWQYHELKFLSVSRRHAKLSKSFQNWEFYLVRDTNQRFTVHGNLCGPGQCKPEEQEIRILHFSTSSGFHSIQPFPVSMMLWKAVKSNSCTSASHHSCWLSLHVTFQTQNTTTLNN